jgi:hypothetical protein
MSLVPACGFQIVEERDANGETVTDLTFGAQDALTLDDIPRIVAGTSALWSVNDSGCAGTFVCCG